MNNISSSNSQKALVPKLRFPEFVDDWTTKKISDILEIKHGKDYKSESAKYGTYPVIGTGGVITYIDSFLCDWDCVCIGRKGTINKPIYMDEPFWSVDTLFYTKPLCGVSKFQYYLFERINWLSYNEASGVPSLSASTIKRIEVNMPSFDEQNKIVQFLSLIDKKIDKQQQLIDTLKLYKRGALQKVFCNIKSPKYVVLSSICEVKKGFQLSKVNMMPNGNYYVLNGGISPSGYTDSFNCQENTISISEGGNSCGFVNFNVDKFWSGGHCYTLENVRGINLKYLYQYLKFQELNIMALRVGSGLPNIQKSTIEKFQILLLPDDTQKTIGNSFFKIDKNIFLQERKLEMMQQLKKSLLQKMFI